MKHLFFVVGTAALIACSAPPPSTPVAAQAPAAASATITATSKSPEALAHFQKGQLLFDNLRTTEAAEEFARALAARPGLRARPRLSRPVHARPRRAQGNRGRGGGRRRPARAGADADRRCRRRTARRPREGGRRVRPGRRAGAGGLARPLRAGAAAAGQSEVRRSGGGVEEGHRAERQRRWRPEHARAMPRCARAMPRAPLPPSSSTSGSCRRSPTLRIRWARLCSPPAASRNPKPRSRRRSSSSPQFWAAHEGIAYAQALCRRLEGRPRGADRGTDRRDPPDRQDPGGR